MAPSEILKSAAYKTGRKACQIHASGPDLLLRYLAIWRVPFFICKNIF